MPPFIDPTVLDWMQHIWIYDYAVTRGLLLVKCVPVPFRTFAY